jgi:hypothetical protein
MVIIASRLSAGNKLFPNEIHLESNGITVKIPGLFSGESKHFDFVHIASVDIYTPMIGFSTITIYAGGTEIAAHGFTKEEVEQVKKEIDTRKAAQKNPSNNINSGGSILDELKKMKDLLDGGAISQQEFDILKAKLINQ